jgi:hypothetical protein
VMFLATLRSSERRSELQSTRKSIDTPFFGKGNSDLWSESQPCSV